MMQRIEIPAHERLPAITEAQRRELDKWAMHNGGYSTVLAVINWLQAAPTTWQRYVLKTWTWGQMADMAGVRRY